jgi:hypothetical protein
MIGKDQLARRIVDNAIDSGAVSHMALVLAETERAQTAAVNRLAKAADAEDAALPPVDKSERKDEILSLVEAVAPGDGDPAEWHARHGLDLDADPEQIAPYVDMESDEWEAQVERWADAYRGSGRYPDVPDRTIADHHVSSTFGAPDLEWFESHVVNVTKAGILRDGTVGRLTAIEESIQTAADAVDE